LLGYPMDELNAVAGITGTSARPESSASLGARVADNGTINFQEADSTGVQPWDTRNVSVNYVQETISLNELLRDGSRASTVFDTGTKPWTSETSAFDAFQRLQSQRVVFDGGSQQVKQYDPNNTHPYNEVDVTQAPDGTVTGAQVFLDQAGATIGQIFGSALGSALGGKDQITRLASNVAGGTIGGLIGQKFGLLVATSMATDLSQVSLTDVFALKNIDIASAGIGAVSSFLTAELGNALQIPGFGGQLFNAAANGFTLSVLTQVKSSITAGLTFDAAISAIDWSAAVSGTLHIENLVGTFLGNLLVPAKSHAGAIGGQLLGAIGSFLLPGLGSLIGTMLGTVIFDAFSNTPHPAATDLIDQRGDFYDYNHYQSFQGGSFDVPDKMGAPAISIVNAYLHAVNGAALDHSKQVVLGYQTDPQSYVSGVPSHPSADGLFFAPGFAVQAAALDLLQHTEVIGGDLLLKRAHHNSSFYNPPPVAPGDTASNGDPGPTGILLQPPAASQLAILSGDLAVAQDYENYLNNREAINALMAVNPNSAFTAGWIATFARVKELGLNHVNASDFTGGLVGWVDSVKKAGLVGASNVSFNQIGNTAFIEIKVANGSNVPGALSAFADQVNQHSDASGTTLQFVFNNGLVPLGFHGPTSMTLVSGKWQVTGGAGNNIWFGTDNAPSVFNAAAGEGNDILVGGATSETIHGGNGWNYIDGGAGNDTITSGSGNDILRGGAGNDVLDGGPGLDTAVFGGKVGSYTLLSYGGAIGVLSHGTEGSDRLQNIEFLQFTDTGIAPGAVAVFDAWEYLASNTDLIGVLGANPQAGFGHYVSNGFSEGRATTSFDPFEYIASNVDLIGAFGLNAADAEQHYIVNGYTEHRPTHSFDAFEYLASNTDLITTLGPNPLAAEKHYITNGFNEHRATHSFDAVEYLASNTDLIAAYGLNPGAAEQHYVGSGFNEHRATHSFDAVEYLASNTDLIGAFGLNVLAAEQHYVGSGYNEHRSTTSFDPFEYLASNPDLIAAFGLNRLAAEQHYVGSGFSEHRATTSFDPFEYIASNVDLIAAFGLNRLAAEQHYITNGFGEHRPTHSFDAVQYLANYADLRAAFGTNLTAAEQHYIQSGYAEGRTDKAPIVSGDGGANTLIAANGAIMTGGAGADIFVFNAALQKPVTITDFTPGADRLQISATGFGHGLVGGGHAPLVTAATAAGATHAGGDGYFIFDNANALWWDPTGGSGTDAIALAKLTGVAALTEQDFVTRVPAVHSDFNADGKSDLLLLNDTSHGVYVCEMDGAAMGANALAFTIDAASGWHYQGIADFDGDRTNDVLLLNVTSNGVYVCEMNGTDLSNNAQAFRIDSPSGWHFQDVGDFNDDGKSDILLMNDVTHGVYVCEMNGVTLGANALAGTIDAAAGWSYKQLADFSGDGKADILFLNTATNAVKIWQMDGTAKVAEATVGSFDAAAGWRFADTGDFNGDGKADMLFLNDTTHGVHVWQMDGTHVAVDAQIGTMPDGFHFADKGDFNGDGKTDLLLLNDLTHAVMVWQMNGTHVDAAVQVGVMAGGYHYLGSGEFNGDGKTDLLFQNDATHGVIQWQMNGTDVLAAAQIATLANGWHIAL
jgi:Ca2+-binding RTX toxin-like protein